MKFIEDKRAEMEQNKIELVEGERRIVNSRDRGECFCFEAGRALDEIGRTNRQDR